MPGAMTAFGVILLIGVVVIGIVAWCFLFKKAGIHPGKLFIPMYGNFLQFDIADSRGLFVATIVVSVLYSIITTIISGGMVSSSRYGSYYNDGAVGTFLVVIVIYLIIMVVIQCIFCVRLARNFGKGGGFAAGLIFLSPIFLCILAFGDAEYQGYGGGTAYKGATGAEWTCPSCHAVNPAHKGVCTVCGAAKGRDM